MKANRNSPMAPALVILLNGKNMVESGHCLGANEETGEVLMVYQNARGQEVRSYDTEVGALIVDDFQAILLKGQVKITVTNEFLTDEAKQDILSGIEKNYEPIQVMRKVRDNLGCGVPTCKAEHTRLEFAFGF